VLLTGVLVHNNLRFYLVGRIRDNKRTISEKFHKNQNKSLIHKKMLKVVSFVYMVWLNSHSCKISPRLSLRILLSSGIRAYGSSLSPDEWAQFDLVSKVFLTEISGKRVSYKCVNGGTSKRSFASAREGIYHCGRETRDC